jgi:hypothetical protein
MKALRGGAWMPSRGSIALIPRSVLTGRSLWCRIPPSTRSEKRLGTEPGTLADFEAEYGPVQPPDGGGSQ